MASDWSTFYSNLESKFKKPNDISISELANFHAEEYSKAVKNAEISLTFSKASIGISSDIVKTGFESVFRSLQSLRVEIKPEYQVEDPTQKMKDSRNTLENIFKPLASIICLEWSKEIFTSTTLPIGYVSPIIGYTVLFPGDVNSLSTNLAKAFFISQNQTDPNIALKSFIEALILAYKEHLITIQGVFSGNVPAAPSPAPGPPFPFIGVV